jgi:hypothetical protein
MEYKVTLNEQQVEFLKSILIQIEPTALIATPSKKIKKLTKLEIMAQKRQDYMADKAAKKRR